MRCEEELRESFVLSDTRKQIVSDVTDRPEDDDLLLIYKNAPGWNRSLRNNVNSFEKEGQK